VTWVVDDSAASGGRDAAHGGGVVGVTSYIIENRPSSRTVRLSVK
jgi:hypothetical protein